MDPNGKKVKSGKTNKKGEFILKKLEPGSYTLQAIHKKLGTGTASITVKDKNLQVKITVPSKPAPQQTAGSWILKWILDPES